MAIPGRILGFSSPLELREPAGICPGAQQGKETWKTLNQEDLPWNVLPSPPCQGISQSTGCSSVVPELSLGAAGGEATLDPPLPRDIGDRLPACPDTPPQKRFLVACFPQPEEFLAGATPALGWFHTSLFNGRAGTGTCWKTPGPAQPQRLHPGQKLQKVTNVTPSTPKVPVP